MARLQQLKHWNGQMGMIKLLQICQLFPDSACASPGILGETFGHAFFLLQQQGIRGYSGALNANPMLWRVGLLFLQSAPGIVRQTVAPYDLKPAFRAK
eukprot:1137869-Pelagomonas_calceolata.AAC.7